MRSNLRLPNEIIYQPLSAAASEYVPTFHLRILIALGGERLVSHGVRFLARHESFDVSVPILASCPCPECPADTARPTIPDPSIPNLISPSSQGLVYEEGHQEPWHWNRGRFSFGRKAVLY